MIQYNHLNQNGTLFIDTPSKQELINLLINHEYVIKIKSGLAIKYHKDQFNKTIGRQVSEDRAKVVDFFLTRTEHFNNKTVYHLHTIAINNQTHITLTTVPKSDRVFLINARSI